MADLREIIDVEVSVQNTSTVVEEFDLLLILGKSKVFNELFRVYQSVTDMITDGFKSSDPEYIAASKVFGQDLSVNQIYVGRRASDSLTATVDTVSPLTQYYAKVDGNTYPYTSGQTPTQQAIATGLVLALASDTVVNVTDNEDGSYIAASKVAGVNWDLTLDADQSYLHGKSKITIDTVTDSIDYTTTINGTAHVFNSGIGATAESIAAGLVAAIAADISADAIDNLDGTYEVVSKTLTTFHTLAVDTNQSYQIERAQISVTAVIEDNTYSTQIDAVPHIYLSGATPSVINIAAGLVAAMSTDPTVNVTDHLDGTYTVTNKVAGTAYTFFVDNKQSFEIATSQTIVEDISAIQAEDNTWYGLIETSRVKADVLLLAEWCEASNKLFGIVTNESDVINKSIIDDTTSLPAILKGFNYRYTFCIYNATPSDFADAALMGRQFAQTAGSSTWALKTLAGVTADNLTATQSKNARDKQCNTYETIAGVAVTRDGTVFDDKYTYIDVVRDLDWMKAAIQQELFIILVGNEKIPYTDGGIQILSAYLKKQLDIAVSMNILSSSPPPVVTAPLAKNVPLIDKQARILHNLNFTAELANAIQKVQIRGVVSY